MGGVLDKDALKNAVQAGRLEWQRHALERMLERGISREEVFRSLLSGEEIEDYPDDLPYPSALYFSRTGQGPLHVVVALDQVGAHVFIVTAYRPDLAHFEADLRTRRTT